MPSALVPMVNGFEEIEAVAIIDILRRAGIDVVTASDHDRSATGSHNITVMVDSTLDFELTQGHDAIVLPGGPGTATLAHHEGLREALVRHAAAGKLLGAICAAPTVLHAAGLLANRRVACFPSVEAKLTGAIVVHEPVVCDGPIVTSRGAGTAVPFALAIAAALVGQETADAVARSIIFC